MQNSYSYSPTMHNGDAYRQSVSMAPAHSINLPPLRPDGHIQQPQAYIPSSQQLSSPPMATYYTPQHNIIYHHPQQMPHLQAIPYRGYGIPIPTSRPHKKEIKRRTKTGCMTCRKRRIKCDEQKPVCRNCVKSKRECQGYDPMHKNQPGSGATAAQRNNGGCCTTQSSAQQNQQPSSPLASTPAANTAIASSPTTTASTGVTTPTSSISYYPPLSASSSFSSTGSFTQPTYSTAPVTQPYASSPVHQAYSTAPLTQNYPTPTLTSYYPASATNQTYTLPSPLPSSKNSNVNGYFPNSSPEPLHAVAAGRHLSGMNRSHGVAIY